MAQTLQSIIESRFLPFVEKPIRYLGNELNIIRKDPSKVSLHGVLCFPDVYDIGMSHFGTQLLYHIVNKHPDWALSRCFHPWEDAERILRNEKIPLYSLEYMMPLLKAHWIGFSVQYELHYTNIVNMLDLGGIPIFSKDRDERHPVVIAGGPCMVNPEPIADFIDAFAIGDGEETIISICECIEAYRREKASKARLLSAFAGLRGVYVPALHPALKRGLFMTPDPALPPVRAAKIGELPKANYPDRPLVPLASVVHHRLAVEVMRGCARGCRFCSAGWYYRPVREKQAKDIIEEIERALTTTGWREVGLLSLSTADYSCFSELLRTATEMRKRRLDVSIPSTRIDSITNDQADMLNAISNVSSFTLAPEAGSERLRRIINKDFTEATIFKTVETLMRYNIQTLKLYFMIGLPMEELSDIEAMIRLIESIAEMVGKRSRRRMVHITISPFSPKAQTPFQWEAMAPIEVLLEKSRSIKHALAHCRNVKVAYHEPETTYLETVMARGDRGLSALIFEAWRSGARNDAWSEHFDFGRWVKAARSLSIDLNRYTFALPHDQPLPWLAITNGASERFLLEERSRALSGVSTPDCRMGPCGGCGICDAKIMNTLFRPSTKAAERDAATTSLECIPPEKTIPHFYRIAYRRNGDMRFLGHRDMMNVFHRAVIAASIPVAFSNGFHPNPRISFGPPLPFGVSGDAELFDIVTSGPVAAETLLSINKWLPRGVEIYYSTNLSSLAESISSVVSAGVYVFFPLFELSKEKLDRIVRKALTQSEIPVNNSSDDGVEGKISFKNIRPLIGELRTVVERNMAGIEAVLSMLPKATCRPAELIGGLFPDRAFEEFSICRKECLKRRGERLAEIEAKVK